MITPDTMINWAHVDADGRIQRWGASAARDIFAQELPAGLTAVVRPDDISGYDRARYVDGQWINEEPPQ